MTEPALALWHIDGELEHLQHFPQPDDRCFYNQQWHCTGCGRIWAWLAFDDLKYVHETRKGRWRIHSRRCPTCGDGTLIDEGLWAYIREVEIPIAILERELQQAIHVKLNKVNGHDILDSRSISDVDG